MLPVAQRYGVSILPLCCYPANCNSFTFSFYVPTTTQIYTLSLHDALPISRRLRVQLLARRVARARARRVDRRGGARGGAPDRKSTRLNSSHVSISYAVFCLKKHIQKLADKNFVLFKANPLHPYLGFSKKGS